MKNPICIFGGSGFIGSRLTDQLDQRGTDLLIADKVFHGTLSPRFVYCDVSNEIDPSQFEGISVIINLAAEHRDDVSPIDLYFSTNVQGAVNVCNLARTLGVKKIIFTSSVAVYGFAEPGVDESGAINPFNEYGRTKWLAENIYRDWCSEDESRTLVIIRPTVVFGERNRGNVFNLLRQIARGKFLMVGDGLNQKSMAYVENVAAFLKYSIDFESGVHIYNYIDKPDFTMNALVAHVRKLLGRSTDNKFRLPLSLGLFIGSCFDFLACITGKKFPISLIRVKKFCANSVYKSNIGLTGFIPPVPLMDALEKTVRFEFIEKNKTEHFFYSE